MSKLFEDSDSDIEIKTNNEYAKSYDTWRKKEELNKFKARHGENALDLDNEDDEDTSDDDDEAVELTQEVEKDFYKTLALLKKNDPSIYDDKKVFFSKSNENEKPLPKNKKDKKMTLRDYERELLLEKGGIISESEDEEIKNPVNFRMDDEMKLKESFKVLGDDSDEDIGTLLKAREQSKDEEVKKEEDYKAWLIGQEKKLKDKKTASSLKPLKDYWTDEKLDEGEKFLRDYLLNNRYLEKDNKNYIPTYNEVVQDLSEDEDELNKQEEFEHKYNFRFEEPDQEFIKRYPRTIEGSLRREDTRRKVKRQEVKDRKAREKEEKMEALKKLRDIKRNEIEEKIEKLKEITGNKDIAFADEDIDGDFDPEEHDRRMQALFNDEYYQDGPEEDVKPPIDLDDEDALELQPENYDNWTGPKDDEEVDEPHCEDDGFNMDADYDPKATQKELVENSRKRKKRKRKSKFVEMLAKDRPKFDPMDKTYEKYIDEYYKFECEDIIDDIPFKFKYRKVVPNNFGLSVEEILKANDRELNKWCSLKKAVSLRDEYVEKYEQQAFEKKGQNIVLKKKILPSLFDDDKKEKKKSETLKVEEDENSGEEKPGSDQNGATEIEPKVSDTPVADGELKKKKKKKKKKAVVAKEDASQTGNSISVNCELPEKNGDITQENIEMEHGTENKKSPKKKKKKASPKNIVEEDVNSSGPKLKNNKEVSFSAKDQINGDGAENNAKKLNKKKKNKKGIKNQVVKEENQQLSSSNIEKNNKKIKKNLESKTSGNKRKRHEDNDNQKSAKKFKKVKAKDLDIGISDARIACFGWNPKKFKNKLIYGNKDHNE